MLCPCLCCWVKYLHWASWSRMSISSYGINLSFQVNHVEKISFCRHWRQTSPAVRAGSIFIAVLLPNSAWNTTTHEDTWRCYRWCMSVQGNGIRWDVASEVLVFIKYFNTWKVTTGRNSPTNNYKLVFWNKIIEKNVMPS